MFPKTFGDSAIKGTTKSPLFSDYLHFHPSISRSTILIPGLLFDIELDISTDREKVVKKFHVTRHQRDNQL